MQLTKLHLVSPTGLIPNISDRLPPIPETVPMRHFCDFCKRETDFIPIYQAVRLSSVSRSTIYYWMEKHWIHWRSLPSKRRVICRESLSMPMTCIPVQKGA